MFFSDGNSSTQQTDRITSSSLTSINTGNPRQPPAIPPPDNNCTRNYFSLHEINQSAVTYEETQEPIAETLTIAWTPECSSLAIVDLSALDTTSSNTSDSSSTSFDPAHSYFGPSPSSGSSSCSDSSFEGGWFPVPQSSHLSSASLRSFGGGRDTSGRGLGVRSVVIGGKDNVRRSRSSQSLRGMMEASSRGGKIVRQAFKVQRARCLKSANGRPCNSYVKLTLMTPKKSTAAETFSGTDQTDKTSTMANQSDNACVQPDQSEKACTVADESEHTCCKTDVVCGSASPKFDEKFSFELLEEDIDKRLVISVWTVEAGGPHLQYRRHLLVGSTSFGLKQLHERPEQSIDGWYYILATQLGQSKHMKVVTPVAKSRHSGLVGEKRRRRRKHRVSGNSFITNNNHNNYSNNNGVSMSAVTTDRRTLYAISIRRGVAGFGFSVAGSNPVLVSRVEALSEAGLAGLLKDDWLLKVNDSDVSASNSVRVAKLIRRCPDVLNIEVCRIDQTSGPATYDQSGGPPTYRPIRNRTLQHSRPHLPSNEILPPTLHRAVEHPQYNNTGKAKLDKNTAGNHKDISRKQQQQGHTDYQIHSDDPQYSSHRDWHSMPQSIDRDSGITKPHHSLHDIHRMRNMHEKSGKDTINVARLRKNERYVEDVSNEPLTLVEMESSPPVRRQPLTSSTPYEAVLGRVKSRTLPRLPSRQPADGPPVNELPAGRHLPGRQLGAREVNSRAATQQAGEQQLCPELSPQLTDYGWIERCEMHYASLPRDLSSRRIEKLQRRGTLLYKQNSSPSLRNDIECRRHSYVEGSGIENDGHEVRRRSYAEGQDVVTMNSGSHKELISGGHMLGHDHVEKRNSGCATVQSPLDDKANSCSNSVQDEENRRGYSVKEELYENLDYIMQSISSAATSHSSIDVSNGSNVSASPAICGGRSRVILDEPLYCNWEPRLQHSIVDSSTGSEIHLGPTVTDNIKIYLSNEFETVNRSSRRRNSPVEHSLASLLEYQTGSSENSHHPDFESDVAGGGVGFPEGHYVDMRGKRCDRRRRDPLYTIMEVTERSIIDGTPHELSMTRRRLRDTVDISNNVAKASAKTEDRENIYELIDNYIKRPTICDITKDCIKHSAICEVSKEMLSTGIASFNGGRGCQAGARDDWSQDRIELVQSESSAACPVNNNFDSEANKTELRHFEDELPYIDDDDEDEEGEEGEVGVVENDATRFYKEQHCLVTDIDHIADAEDGLFYDRRSLRKAVEATEVTGQITGQTAGHMVGQTAMQAVEESCVEAAGATGQNAVNRNAKNKGTHGKSMLSLKKRKASFKLLLFGGLKKLR